jgi:site-specific recombinase XerD
MRSAAKFNQIVVQRYAEWMAVQHYARLTRRAYSRTIRLFVEFLGTKSLAAVTHLDVREFLARISKEGASLRTTYFHLQVLRVFYDFLNLGGVVSYVAPRLIRVRPPTRNLPPLFSEKEIQNLIEATKSLRERALVEFLYGTDVV